MAHRPADLRRIAEQQAEIVQLRRDLRSADLRSVDLRFMAVDRSTDLATGELRGRLAILNELRGDVVSRGEFNTKVDGVQRELSAELKALSQKIDTNTDRLNVSQGKSSGLDASWGYLVGALGLVLVAGDIVLRLTGH